MVKVEEVDWTRAAQDQQLLRPLGEASVQQQTSLGCVIDDRESRPHKEQAFAIPTVSGLGLIWYENYYFKGT